MVWTSMAEVLWLAGFMREYRFVVELFGERVLLSARLGYRLKGGTQLLQLA
jgi:hypothetical protein